MKMWHKTNNTINNSISKIDKFYPVLSFENILNGFFFFVFELKNDYV